MKNYVIASARHMGAYSNITAGSDIAVGNKNENILKSHKPQLLQVMLQRQIRIQRRMSIMY